MAAPGVTATALHQNQILTEFVGDLVDLEVAHARNCTSIQSRAKVCCDAADLCPDCCVDCGSARFAVYLVVHRDSSRPGAQHAPVVHCRALRFCGGQNGAPSKSLRASLLYSTGKRGHVIENLFLRVSEGGRRAEFSFWGYGETDHLVIGGGLSIPEAGVSTNHHHFNPVNSDELFLFSGGDYTLQLLAKLVGRKRLSSLWTVTVTVPEGIFSNNRIAQRDEVSFNWSPEQNKFLTSVRTQSDPVIRGI
jgi:hypothetical protein